MQMSLATDHSIQIVMPTGEEYVITAQQSNPGGTDAERTDSLNQALVDIEAHPNLRFVVTNGVIQLKFSDTEE